MVLYKLGSDINLAQTRWAMLKEWIIAVICRKVDFTDVTFLCCLFEINHSLNSDSSQIYSMHVCIKCVWEYLRSIWVSCNKLQMGSQPVNLLKPRFISDNVDWNSNSLHTKQSNSWWRKQPSCWQKQQLWDSVYLEGTEVNRFLLKLTAVTPWLTAASNTSSGMAAVCFSLHTDRKGNFQMRRRKVAQNNS